MRTISIGNRLDLCDQVNISVYQNSISINKYYRTEPIGHYEFKTDEYVAFDFSSFSFGTIAITTFKDQFTIMNLKNYSRLITSNEIKELHIKNCLITNFITKSKVHKVFVENSTIGLLNMNHLQQGFKSTTIFFIDCEVSKVKNVRVDDLYLTNTKIHLLMETHIKCIHYDTDDDDDHRITTGDVRFKNIHLTAHTLSGYVPIIDIFENDNIKEFFIQYIL